MKTENTKDNGSKRQYMDFGFCNQKNFQNMFEMCDQCFAGRDTKMDCSSMMDGIVKNRMDMCYPSNSTEFKDKTENKKNHEA
ncbi:MAG: hypothetical protein KJO26_03870 [Deltaproteobacteria bacterium]|nr:hypothetical protein [Deltaproteobacteria bacterium]